MVYSHLQAPLASLATKNISMCVHMSSHFLKSKQDEVPLPRHNHKHIYVSCCVFNLWVNVFVKRLYLFEAYCVKLCVCMCVWTWEEARVALREELQQRGRRFTPHWQARRANHRQQIRPSGCRLIP